ncbi:MAG: hypothetical protein WKF84_14500 [Pyrinomonadaceae bacterium]
MIIATGVRRRRLGAPGAKELEGRGVSGIRNARPRGFRRQGCLRSWRRRRRGGERMLLAEVCATVTLVHRGPKLRARDEFVERGARRSQDHGVS